MSSSSGSSPSSERALPVPSGGGCPGSMPAWAEELVARAPEEGVDSTGEQGLLTSMVREVPQAGLDVEMTEHLGYEPYEAIGRGSGNSPKKLTAREHRSSR